MRIVALLFHAPAWGCCRPDTRDRVGADAPARKADGHSAQQTFEPRPVGALDAHRALHRKAPVVRPGTPLGGIILVDPGIGGASGPMVPQAALHHGQENA